jgi:hypothetical protein
MGAGERSEEFWQTMQHVLCIGAGRDMACLLALALAYQVTDSAGWEVGRPPAVSTVTKSKYCASIQITVHKCICDRCKGD